MARVPADSRWSELLRPEWNRVARGWDRWEPQLQHLLGAVDPSLFRALELRPGQRVLDLGCGPGEPTLAVAELVGPEGRVTGIDLSREMLALARRRAKLRHIRNVRFRLGDLAKLRLGEKRYDRIVCRFGIFFAQDLPATLDDLRRALVPKGRAAFAVWGPLEKNAAWKLRADVAARFLPPPELDTEEAPDPLRFARRGLLARRLTEAGFRDVEEIGVGVPVVVQSPEEFVAMTFDTSATLGRLAREFSVRDRKKLRDGLLRGARKYREGEAVRFPGFAWVVSGRR